MQQMQVQYSPSLLCFAFSLQALWHEKEGSEELRVLVHRLKNDLDNTKSLAVDTQVRV